MIYFFFVWIEPVRDWNAFNLSTTSFISPCELNLWGIETKLTQQIIYIIHCVNWTCEGLKRNLSSENNLGIHGVNWTCEGLKQITGKIKVIFKYTCELNLWGIETMKK